MVKNGHIADLGFMPQPRKYLLQDVFLAQIFGTLGKLPTMGLTPYIYKEAYAIQNTVRLAQTVYIPQF